jgi:hypothetical protein
MLVIMLFAFAADLLAGDVRIMSNPIPLPRPALLCYWSLGTGCIKPYDDRYPQDVPQPPPDARLMGMDCGAPIFHGAVPPPCPGETRNGKGDFGTGRQGLSFPR